MWKDVVFFFFWRFADSRLVDGDGSGDGSSSSSGGNSGSSGGWWWRRRWWL